MTDCDGIACTGDGSGRLQVQGTKVSRSASMGGRPKEGEFLQITQSSPLVDPSEVVVTSRDIQFAQAVLSPHGTFASLIQHSLIYKYFLSIFCGVSVFHFAFLLFFDSRGVVMQLDFLSSLNIFFNFLWISLPV